MIANLKTLLDLNAADVMSREVVVLPREMSLRSAARLMSGSHISGAPVVDENGCCIGVLSATDFMNWTGGNGNSNRARPGQSICYCADWQVANTETLPDERVERFMTPDPVSLSPGAPISAVARCMLDAHIHRVIVVNEQGRPIGVVTSTDILAAVARAGMAV